jgi:hypothetical protein
MTAKDEGGGKLVVGLDRKPPKPNQGKPHNGPATTTVG